MHVSICMCRDTRVEVKDNSPWTKHSNIPKYSNLATELICPCCWWWLIPSLLPNPALPHFRCEQRTTRSLGTCQGLGTDWNSWSNHPSWLNDFRSSASPVRDSYRGTSPSGWGTNFKTKQLPGSQPLRCGTKRCCYFTVSHNKFLRTLFPFHWFCSSRDPLLIQLAVGNAWFKW